jgi:hypothetical protein
MDMKLGRIASFVAWVAVPTLAGGGCRAAESAESRPAESRSPMLMNTSQEAEDPTPVVRAEATEEDLEATDPEVEPEAETPAAPEEEEERELEDPLAELQGSYRYIGGAHQRDAMKQAIDKVVDQMGLGKNIARRRLLESNEVPQRLEIERQGNQLTVKFDGRSYSGRLGGKPIRVQSVTGEPVQMTLRQRGERLLQVYAGEGGTRYNLFAPRADDRLTLRVRITSERLPDDIIYYLSFRK